MFLKWKWGGIYFNKYKRCYYLFSNFVVLRVFWILLLSTFLVRVIIKRGGIGKFNSEKRKDFLGKKIKRKSVV